MKLILSNKLKYIFVEPKTILLAGLLTGLFQLLENQYRINFPLVLVLSGAMFIDLVTGIRRAMINGDMILSQGLRKTVDKVIQYFCFICLVVIYVIVHLEVFPNHRNYVIWLPKTYIIYLILTELKSIGENLKGNKDLPVASFMSWVDKLLSYFKNKNNTNTNK